MCCLRGGKLDSLCVCVSSLQSSAAASGQIDLQPNAAKAKCSRKHSRRLRLRNSIPFCRFDKRFQGVATISASKWVQKWEPSKLKKKWEKETQQKKRKNEAKTDNYEEEDEDTCKQRIAMAMAIPIPILIPIPIARECVHLACPCNEFLLIVVFG